MLDRLLLTEQRITEMANGIREVAIPDQSVPWIKCGAMLTIFDWSTAPLGVIGIIYEALMSH